MISLKSVAAAAVALGLLGLTAEANALTYWQRHHRRRTEVNARLGNQNERIHEGVESGQLSSGEAHQLHSEDRAIRQQERMDAAANGGHLTNGEQQQLNQEENAVSHQIYNEKHGQ